MEMLTNTQEINELNTDYSSKSILVVDDVQINYLLVKALLKQTGAKVIWADDGFKAIDIVNSKRKIDLVLMDYNMPGMDGSTTTKIIKRKKKDLPVVLHSTYSNGLKLDNSVGVYNDILVKPVTSLMLLSIMKKYI
ncbi:MAG TPA: response regulator [Bacteroidales bacterium]|jgi:CheY-like chemotaxis protein|nr:response regulator [Bacteroidales bacterium]|tara:strand:+ start:3604 stop:4011 length:408 start_codon:yes stop_codon:yes gene_type:complete